MHRWRWVWDPQYELSKVVNHSMWTEIPWSRSGRQAVGRLGGEYPYIIFPLREDVILSWSAWQVDIYLNVFQAAYFYKRRCYPAEHLLRNTPIWVWLLNVAVCESWVLFNKLMKGLGVWPPAGKPCGSPVSVKDLRETRSHQTCIWRHSPLSKLRSSVT